MGVGLAERVGALPFGEFPRFIDPTLPGWTVEAVILISFAPEVLHGPASARGLPRSGRDLEAGQPRRGLCSDQVGRLTPRPPASSWAVPVSRRSPVCHKFLSRGDPGTTRSD